MQLKNIIGLTGIIIVIVVLIIICIGIFIYLKTRKSDTLKYLPLPTQSKSKESRKNTETELMDIKNRAIFQMANDIHDYTKFIDEAETIRKYIREGKGGSRCIGIVDLKCKYTADELEIKYDEFYNDVITTDIVKRSQIPLEYKKKKYEEFKDYLDCYCFLMWSFIDHFKEQIDKNHIRNTDNYIPARLRDELDYKYPEMVKNINVAKELEEAGVHFDF